MFFRFHPFLRRARQKVLTKDEKDAVRNNLLSFMAAHPIRAGTNAPSFSRKYLPHLVPLLAVLTIALIGVGTVSAAEGTLPTDRLYPVKIYINEPLQRAFARTPEAKAQMDARFVLRRLDEGKALEHTDALTQKTQERLEKIVERQTKHMEKELKTLRRKGQEKRAEKIVETLEQAVDEQETLTEREQRIKKPKKDTFRPFLKRAKTHTRKLHSP